MTEGCSGSDNLIGCRKTCEAVVSQKSPVSETLIGENQRWTGCL